MLNLKALTLAVVVGVLSPVVSMNILNAPQVLAQTQEEQKAEADRLWQQADKQLKSGEYQAALQSFQQALAIYLEISDSQGVVVATLGTGYAYAYLGETEKATEIFEWFLKAAQKTNNSELEKLAKELLKFVQNQNNPQKAQADQLLQQGSQQFRANQFQEAIQSWETALKIYQKIGDRNGELKSLVVLSIIYDSLGQYKKTIELYEQSLAIAREFRSRNREAFFLSSLGGAYSSLEQYQKAIEFYQQSLLIFQETNDSKEEARSLSGLGNAYFYLSQYQKATKFYQQSLLIFQEINDHIGEANTLNNLGMAYQSIGEYKKAVELFNRSLSLTQEVSTSVNPTKEARREEARSLEGLGNVYLVLGQYRKAIEFHNQSLTIQQDTSDLIGKANSLLNLGFAYFSLGEYLKAIEFYNQSLTIAQEIDNHRVKTRSLGGLGLTYRSLSEHEKAIEVFQQSLTIAREIGDIAGEANALGNLGGTYHSLNQYERAIEFHQQSLPIFQKIGNYREQAGSLHNLGTALLFSRKPREAEAELRKAIALFESIRIGLNQDSDKVSIFDTYLGSFRVLQLALVDQNKIDAALEVSEKGRARSLVELISERLNNSQQGLVPTTKPLNLEQIRQTAKNQDSTFIQYSIVGMKNGDITLLYIWVVQPTGEITFKEVDLSSLDTPLREIVDNSRIDIGARGRTPATVGFEPSEEFLQEQQAKQTANLRLLHDLLIKPIADLLPTDPLDKVVFMPQGELYLVPFPALIDEQNQYLIEKHTILTSPSIQLLDIARQSHNEKRNNPDSEVLIVGNPTMPELWNPNSGEVEQLSSLQGAYNEAVAIAEKFQVEPIVQGNATEPIVTQKMQTARLIHLATHGLLEYGIPEESGVLDAPGAIALAPAGDADGLLTSVEIYNMNLQAELVVLSACDTGRGKISGDGVIGLSRAFLQAGVPSLIVSLWKVPDESTQFLMTKFYDYWQEDMDKVTALRQAILDTKKEYPQPINWAAFTLVGEAK